MLLEAVGQHHLLVSIFFAMLLLFGVGPFVGCTLPLVLR